MLKYNEEYLAKRGLQRVIRNPNKPDKIKEVAKRVLEDKKLFHEYVLMKKEKLESIQKKIVLKEKKKNLTGWKKWFILILPEGLGLFLGLL